MDFKNIKFIKTVKGNKLIIGALVLGLMLLIIPWGNLTKSKDRGFSVNAGESTGSVPEFSLRDEERRLETALSKIEGAGNVSVVLTLETGSERRLATDNDSSRDTDADGSTQVREKSETVTVSNEAVTVIYVYPRYRGALVIASGSSSAVKLQITQAVSALTGLTTDRITVVKGSA
jgi:stage III sporulation protein AG